MATHGAGGDCPRDDKEKKQGEGGAAGGSSLGATGDRSGTGISTEQILETGEHLLNGFISDRLQNNPDVAGARVLFPGISQQSDPSIKRLSECLRKIGDELDANMELQRRIDNVPCTSPKQVFFHVAKELFADGVFNWGRVVALFYFACKLVVKALCTKVPEMIRTIINWTMDYLRDYVVQWIRDQGGWEGMLSYFGTPTWQTVGVFLAGVLTASLAIWKMS
ncbi:BCL2-associated X protein L homeolog [Xenopus laevis]|uniref:Apoptosis regulator BAX n=1 Tax=Xenopus laevis TaxID=8355 RepID=Q98U13_XENLA|nr:BCL2-associated X protein L homeolog [Xenopus laevis]AAI69587.1 BCL2-associated X protein [Xenopus laevis]AAI69589.1 BCL2-associated X protein [Xenopus laevis]AAK06406.1 bax [Xenopus laevis]AAR84081.1 Bax [Xenopus laevis]